MKIIFNFFYHVFTDLLNVAYGFIRTRRDGFIHRNIQYEKVQKHVKKYFQLINPTCAIKKTFDFLIARRIYLLANVHFITHFIYAFRRMNPSRRVRINP
jgi:hypothetical protein